MFQTNYQLKINLQQSFVHLTPDNSDYYSYEKNASEISAVERYVIDHFLKEAFARFAIFPLMLTGTPYIPESVKESNHLCPQRKRLDEGIEQ